MQKSSFRHRGLNSAHSAPIHGYRSILWIDDVNHLAATVVTIDAHMVAAMEFTRGGITRKGRTFQGVMGTAHSALGGSFAILLYGHGRIVLKTGIL